MKLIFKHDKVFFTSDCHFMHKNIIAYCNRPFGSVEEMNEELIKRWNEVVPPDGTVFILGDFVWAKSENDWVKFLVRLNGEKILIRGNHDNNIPDHPAILKARFEQVFVTVKGDEEISEQDIMLNHYPMLVWNKSHRGSWQLFGHIHSGPNSMTTVEMKDVKGIKPNQYDVGVDNNDFTPVSFQQIKEIITKQNLYASSQRTPKDCPTSRIPQ